MRKILIFGNSGSGKSTLAAKICQAEKLPHLDLDTLAWQVSDTPKRAPLEVSQESIQQFIEQNQSWIIEGCYSYLLEIAGVHADEIIFMNLPVTLCIENAKNRPWEPHKYESKEAQDENLDMLVGWIAQYEDRNDVFSQRAHTLFYESFSGQKKMITQNMNSI
ncbi:MAG: shikimate kinase [SAR86 cluster bacterium]|uniref:Shikimate kinase n=1 Tax=SAR86 cluster bacterium TaxID=2030880 RepID=A0A2A5AJC4_9GAMM|nr:MAG: shikimate kinase [SAR86 cluster bacterium]